MGDEEAGFKLGMPDVEGKGAGEGIAACPRFLGVHLSPVVTNTTSDFRWCTIMPHDASNVHLLVHRRTPGGVDELGYVVRIVHRPVHLASVPGIYSGSAHEEGDIGADGREADAGFGEVMVF